MNEQTTIEPCEFCGEPSVERVEIVPAETESRGGVKYVKKAAIKAHVCAPHAAHVRAGRGWQEAAKDKSRKLTRQAKQRLKKTQAQLW